MAAEPKPKLHQYPIISGTMVFDRSSGPRMAPLSVIVSVTPSLEHLRARISMASIIGSHALTVHQAAMLRDQLDSAIVEVLESCPEMATPDEEPLPKETARG